MSKGDSRAEEFQRQLWIVLNVDLEISKRQSAFKRLTELIQDPQSGPTILGLYEKLLASLVQLSNDKTFTTQAASALGLLGAVTKQNSPKFIFWIFQNISSGKNLGFGPISKEKQLFFLFALKEFLVRSEKASLQRNMPALWHSMIGYLDTIDTPELFVTALDAIQYLTSAYPEQFMQNHFQDLVNFIVRVRLDIAHNEQSLAAIGKCFLDFHSLWHKYKPFTAEVLGNIVVAMFHLVDRDKPPASRPENEPSGSPSFSTRALGSPIFVPGSGLVSDPSLGQGLGSVFVPGAGITRSNPNPPPAPMSSPQSVPLSGFNKGGPKPPLPAQLSYYLDIVVLIVKGVGKIFPLQFDQGGLLARFFLCLKTIHECYHNSSWPLQVIRRLLDLAETFGPEQFSPLFTRALEVIGCIISPPPPSPTMRNFLTAFHQIIDLQLATLPLGAKKLFSPDFLELRLHNDPEVTSTLVQLYKQIVGSNSLDIVQQAVLTLTEEMASLCLAVGQTPQTHIIHHETKKDVKIGSSKKGVSQKDALKMLTFDLIVVGCIRDQAHRKKVLDLLLTKYDPISENSVVSKFPVVQLAAINSICALVSIEVVPFDDARLVALLIGAFKIDSPRIKLGVLDWLTTEIILRYNLNPRLPSSSDLIIPSSLLMALLCLSNDREERIRISLAENLLKLAVLRCFDEQQITDIVSISMMRLADTRKAVVKAYMALLQNISPAVLPDDQFMFSKYDDRKTSAASTFYYLSKPLGSAWQECLKDSLKETTELFQRQHFTRIMNFINLRGPADQEFEGHDWISRMTFCCDSLNAIRDHGRENSDLQSVNSIHGDEKQAINDTFVNFLSSSCTISRTVAYFWALLECSRYCINSKLRTPFGPPGQTFEAIQRMVVKSASLVESNQQEAHQERTSKKEISWRDLQKHNKQLSVRLLLQFIDQLEKHISHAYERSLHLPSIANAQTLQFFKANKKVCLDWFIHRVRQPIMMTAIAANSPADIIRHGYERREYLYRAALAYFTKANEAGTQILSIKDPEKLYFDLETTIRYIANALCNLGHTDALQGLYGWYKIHIKPWQKQKVIPNLFFGLSSAIWFQPLILHSTNRFEEAINAYKELFSKFCQGLEKEKETLLTSEKDAELIFENIRFVSEKLIECFISLSDWKSATIWLAEFHKQIDPIIHEKFSQKIVNPVQIEYMKALMKFDSKEFSEVKNTFHEIKKLRGDSDLYVDWCDPRDRLQRSEELMILSLAEHENLRLNEIDKSKRTSAKLETALFMIQDSLHVTGTMSVLHESYPYLVQAQCIGALEKLMNKIRGGEEETDFGSLLSPLESRILDPGFHEPGLWNKVLRVKKYFLARCGSQQTDVESTLLVKLVKLARKQGNLRLASTLISQIRLKQSLDLELEQARLLYATSDPSDQMKAISQLWAVSRDILTKQENNYSYMKSERNTIVRIFLKLANWLVCDNQTLTFEKLFGTNNSDPNLTMISSIEKLSEDCLEKITQMEPNSADSWYCYATHCYREGQTTVNKITQMTTTTCLPASMEDEYLRTKILIPEEEKKLTALLVELEINSSVKSDLMRKLRQKIFSKLTEGLSEENQSSSLLVKKEIGVLFRSILSEEQIVVTKEQTKQFVDLWMMSRKRILTDFEKSIVAYFRFLSIGDVGFGDDRKQAKDQMHSTKAALSILNLIVKYGADLRQCLVSGFEKTPTTSWCNIIPQLFSHLGHPDAWVKLQVTNLIIRIGRGYPSEIVYPVVVACSPTTTVASSTLSQYQEIQADFLKHSPVLVEEVKNMIEEFERVALMWEEKWIVLLRSAQSDVNTSRLRTIKDEITRINENHPVETRNDLIQEKYTAIMKPVALKLVRLMKETIDSETLETPYEKNYFVKYGSIIREAYHSFCNPKDFSDLDNVFGPFKQLLLRLTKNAKKSSHKLSSVSPKLSKLQSSSIPIPGLPPQHHKRSFISIQSFEPVLQVLPSKTKPKKIIMRASDGSTYPFLLKGREDLHLDERVMQFLTIVNQMLNRDHDTAARSLRARNYAVIPFSSSSGLIQWVEHVVPLFSVYKNWQQNLQPPDAPKKKIESPMDKFYAKIVPQLKAKGIQGTPRKDWPTDLLKKVFHELVNETPSDLFSRELWCNSTSVSQWWQNTQAFARSVAVSSIVGYTIGLGDRHLDNILIDFSTGEIVHIDYNVCFDKGQKLLIPEIVPFRLTQTIQKALGPNGVEGCFRIACENVTRVLRSQKETLLTLLEAFVYDPLVDWTGDIKTQNEEFKMDLAVTLNLLSTRIFELQPNFDTNIASLEEKLTRVCNSVAVMSEAMRELNSLESAVESKITQLDGIKQSASKISSTLSNTNNSLEATQRKSTQLANMRSDMHQLMDNALQRCNTQQEFHLKTIVVVLGPSIAKLKQVEQPGNSGSGEKSMRSLECICAPAASQLFRQALRTQYSEMDKKLTDIQGSWKSCLNITLDLLVQYRTAVLMLPSDYHTYNVAWNWAAIWRQINELSRIEVQTDEKAIQIIETEYEVVTTALNNFSLHVITKIVISHRQSFLHLHNQIIQTSQQTASHQAMIESFSIRFYALKNRIQDLKKVLLGLETVSRDNLEVPFLFLALYRLQVLVAEDPLSNPFQYVLDGYSLLGLIQDQYGLPATTLLISHDPENWNRIMTIIHNYMNLFLANEFNNLLFFLSELVGLLRYVLSRAFPKGTSFDPSNPVSNQQIQEYLLQCRELHDVSGKKEKILIEFQESQSELIKMKMDIAVFCWLNESWLIFPDPAGEVGGFDPSLLKLYTFKAVASSSMAGAMLPTTTRIQLIDQLKSSLANLQKANQLMSELMEQYGYVEEQAMSRLDWASKQGQDQYKIYQTFCTGVESRKECFSTLSERVGSTIQVAQDVLQFEGFRVVVTDDDKNKTSEPSQQMHYEFLALARNLKNILKEERVITETVLQHKDAISTTKLTQKSYATQENSINSEISDISLQLETSKIKAVPIFQSQNLTEDGILGDLKAICQYAKGTEQQTLGTEISSLLQTVTRITENWNSVSAVHQLSKKLQRNQMIFSRELDLLITNSQMIINLATAAIQAGTKPAPPPEPMDYGRAATGRGRAKPPVQKDMSSAVVLKRVDVKAGPKNIYQEVSKLPHNYFKTHAANLIDTLKKIIKQLLQIPTCYTPEGEEESGSQDGEETARQQPNNDQQNKIDSDSEDDSTFSKMGQNTKHQAKPTKHKPTIVQHNAMAVNIVNRVRQKLEGVDGTRPLSVSEQVDWVIQEAKSSNNLCKMYEGWASWI